MQRLFIETEIFTSQIEAQKDADLLANIQQTVLTDLSQSVPERDVIKGTGGFTKVRVADQKGGKGKSGGFRVIYFDLPKQEITFLFLLYSKSVKDTLTSAQVAGDRKSVV